jgi:hypothetical protein
MSTNISAQSNGKFILPSVYIDTNSRPPSGAVSLEALIYLSTEVSIFSPEEIFRAFFLSLTVLIWAAQTYTRTSRRLDRTQSKQQVFQESNSNAMLAKCLNKTCIAPLQVSYAIKVAVQKRQFFADEMVDDASLRSAMQGDVGLLC